jgi:hypothetical protein
MAPGPVPWSGPDEAPVRLRETRGSIETRHEVTLWDEGQGPIEAKQRIAALRAAVPQVVRQRLAETRPAAGPNGGPLFDQLICDAWLTVVSLSPDVLIVTIRERPAGSDDDLFKEWDWMYITSTPDLSRGDEEADLIDAEEGIGGFFAGHLLPWSEEMYVVSTEPGVVNERLRLDDNRGVIALPVGRLILSRDENFVSVVRE